MKVFRLFLICALVVPVVSAQTKFLGSYPAASALTGSELMPVVQGGAVLESSPAAMLTYIQQFFTVTWANMGSGTNTTGTMFCGSGCEIGHTGTGIVDASEVNSATVPPSLTFVGTNASGAFVQQNGITFAVLTWAAINALGCSGSNTGATYFISDSNQTTYRGVISGSSAGHAVLAVCDGTNWTAH